MTKEEVLNILNSLKQYYNDKNQDSYAGFDDEDNEALDMAIEVLEQEPKIEDINIKRMLIEANVNGYAEGRKDVLDKVRAEIMDYEEHIFNLTNDFADYDAVEHCVDIIDKYMEESEKNVCKGCYYNDGEVHAECVICDKVESEIVEMNLDDSIKNVKSECYVSPSLNMDRAIMVNTSLDMLINKVEKTKELLTRYDTRSATKCYEIVQMLKEEFEV